MKTRCGLLIVSIGLALLFSSSDGSAQAADPQQDFDCADVQSIPVIECEALAAFYHATGGNGWTQSSGWLVESDPTLWHGVTVNEGHVEKLVLQNNNLTGSLPAQLADLSRLTELNVRDNQLSGALPAGIGSLSSLIILDLSNNQFSGGLPAGLFNLTALRFLYLDHNQFGGFLSDGFGSLTNLDKLWLNDNYFLGFPPSAFTNLTQLDPADSVNPGNDGLNLDDNRLCVPANYPQTGNPLHEFLNLKDPDFHQRQNCHPPFEVFLPMVQR